eukprot:CAMPEP_0168470576 /NCGR_PEP_ID=MMETSP0228-20121227/58805_1 /TAXON_ID=133427 /ORGANISM="Protoceratium reticulatum, Strain CCCM 535 (=CCMP 1889)" /LENGTH=839 /DNA_ID=CAMNT_0008486393 /DNA_START=1 /DNA_END=2517 /DNA_ORIENTATION=-
MHVARGRVAPLSAKGPWQLLVALGTGCLARPTVDDGSALLQRQPSQARPALAPGAGTINAQAVLVRGAGEEVAPQQRGGEGSWTAEPFGDCSSTFCGFPVKTRKVTCRSWKTGEIEPPASCNMRPRPHAAENCSCPPEVCEDHPEGPKLCGPRSSDEVSSNEAAASSFEVVGCYNRSAEVPNEGACPKAMPVDERCMGWEGTSACSGGLPFFRNCTSLDHASCADFCIRRGLDLFGIVKGAECRCGASVLNENVWHGKTPPTALLFQDGPDGPWDHNAGECPLLLLRYTGYFASGGMPQARTTRVVDKAYIDGLVKGHHMSPAQELDRLPTDNAQMQSRHGSAAAPWVTRNCWPSECGPWVGPVEGGQPQTTAPQGMDARWNHYFIMQYHFSSELATQGAGDPAKIKEVFRAAVKVWHREVCIFLEERTGGTRMEIVQTQASSCHVQWSRDSTGYTFEVNLGWCNDMNHLGSVVHEIGHVLGMNHEQKRSDAAVQFHGQGPYLKMQWQNIDSYWRPQWAPDPNTYVGSANDGQGDPVVGYAPYDFRSIMHYPPDYTKPEFEPVDPNNAQFLGAQVLSTGDINEVKDLYQCILNSNSGATTTTTTIPLGTTEVPLGTTTTAVVPTTESTTTPSTVITTQSTTAPTTAPTEVTGFLVLIVVVLDVNAFVHDPASAAGVAQGLATVTGFPLSYIIVVLSAGPISMRQHNLKGGLHQMQGGVNADFTINVPAGADPTAANSLKTTPSTEVARAISAGVAQTTGTAPNLAVTRVGVRIPTTASSYGDPHITTLQGEKFDILRPGTHTYLVVPRGTLQNAAQLHIQGNIKADGPTCGDGLFLRGL